MKLTKEQMQAAIQQIEADGWRVVPTEPTVKVLEEIGLDGNFSYLAMVTRYESMLAVSPKYLHNSGET